MAATRPTANGTARVRFMIVLSFFPRLWQQLGHAGQAHRPWSGQVADVVDRDVEGGWDAEDADEGGRLRRPTRGDRAGRRAGHADRASLGLSEGAGRHDLALLTALEAPARRAVAVRLALDRRLLELEQVRVTTEAAEDAGLIGQVDCGDGVVPVVRRKPMGRLPMFL